MRLDRRSRLVGSAYLSCMAAWAVLAWPWMFGGLIIPYDAKAHFHAQLQFLANAFHSGQSPFWNPNAFAGSPHIADPQSLIFSPAVLIALFDPSPGIGAVDFYALGLLAASALAILAFFIDRGWHPVGGVVAAIAFSFGASAAWRIQHIGQIQSYAFFAIALWLLGRALDRRSIGWGIAAGLAAGTMVVEPDQVALLGCYLLAGYGLAHLLRQADPWQALRSHLPAMLATGLACALLAAGPIVLTYLFVEGSNRPDVPLLEAGRGSLHPASLLTAVIGDLFGAFDPKVEYWGPYSMAWDPTNLSLTQNMGQLYVGALPALLLITVGIVRRQAWQPEIRYFSISLLVIVVYGLGAFTPAFRVMYDALPGVHLFRRPADATFMIGGLAAIVGGYLVHRLMIGAVPAAGLRQRAGEVAVVAAVMAAGLIVARGQGQLTAALRPVGWAVASLLAAGLLVTSLQYIRRIPAELALAGVAAFVTADVAINNGPNESTALPAANYDFLRPNCRNDTIGFIKSATRQPAGSARRDRVELAGLGFEWPNAGLIHGFDHVLGYNPVRLEDATRIIGAGDTIAGWQQRQFTPLFPSYRSAMADLLGLRFIAVPVPVEQLDPSLKPGDLKLVRRTKEAFIYENPRALPRAMFVGHWKKVDFEQLVETGRWPEFDPAVTVLLEVEPKAARPSVSAAGEARVPAQVRMPIYENTLIEIDVTAQKAGFVVLNGVWHPWWRASVDDQPADILKANVMFRAVEVPAGRHRVRFEFDPIAGALQEIEQRTSSAPAVVASRARKRASRRPRT